MLEIATALPVLLFIKESLNSANGHPQPFFFFSSPQAAPIVRVAVEPADPADIPALVRGLRLLNRADPFVEVLVSGSGEHVIGAAGEVHLERCIRDLQV